MADQEDIEERDEQEQVVDALVPNGHVVEPEATSESQLKKIDWEIPRKVLHSSIGACSSLLLWAINLKEPQDSSHYTSTYPAGRHAL